MQLIDIGDATINTILTPNVSAEKFFINPSWTSDIV